MPTYDYVCEACEHEFELFQKMTDKVKRTCPECGRKKLKRLIGTGAGILFKGGGFYETDYRSESYKKAAEAESKTAKGGEKTADSKADSKSGSESGTKKSAGKDGATPSKAAPKKKGGKGTA